MTHVASLTLVIALGGFSPVGVGEQPNACPVTIPNRTMPPTRVMDNFMAGFKGTPPPGFFDTLHGNGMLWTWIHGFWNPETAMVHIPANMDSDGSLRIKYLWLAAADGQITIEGRKLDHGSSRVRVELFRGASNAGLMPSGLVFPAVGCWEVTAKTGGSTLTFTTSVVAPRF